MFPHGVWYVEGDGAGFEDILWIAETDDSGAVKSIADAFCLPTTLVQTEWAEERQPDVIMFCNLAFTQPVVAQP